MKEKFESFKSNYLYVGLSIINILLLISMIWSPEKHNAIFWFNAVFHATFPLIALFFGGKGIWLSYFVYTNIHALNMTYDNLTCIAIISLLFTFTPELNLKQGIAMTTFYLTDVFVVASLHDKTPWHIYVHLLRCSAFCLAMWYLKVTVQKKSELKLLPDERKILEQLAEGKQQKEVQGFSESTVSRKLQKAADRNKLSTEELKMRFSKNNCQ